MGLEELLSTLKKNEQKQIDDIWQSTKTEAATLRQQLSETIANITQNHAEQLASACQKSRRSIFSATEVKTRGKKLFAYQAFDQALHNAAIKELPVLRKLNYEKTFASLVNELPESQWEKIVVNPVDLDLAATFFSANTITSDPAISGGLVAVTANGKIVIDNTFETRLKRRWFLLLPAIIAKFEKRHEKTGAFKNTE